MSAEVVTLYATFPPDFDIEALAKTLLEEGLIACCNSLGGVRSIYRWNGAIETDIEVAALFKTTNAQAEAATTRICALHPYETPCVIAWPVLTGAPDYLNWVKSQTR
jgi:periplasmic divalent cation tolerance protein